MIYFLIRTTVLPCFWIRAEKTQTTQTRAYRPQQRVALAWRRATAAAALALLLDLVIYFGSSKAAAAAGREQSERQRRAAAPKARLCGLCSFPRVTGAISETNYWNTSSIPIFVRWKKRMSLSYPNSIFLPGFCLSLLKFHSVSWLVENPIYIGFNHLWMSCE